MWPLGLSMEGAHASTPVLGFWPADFPPGWEVKSGYVRTGQGQWWPTKGQALKCLPAWLVLSGWSLPLPLAATAFASRMPASSISLSSK